MRWHTTGRRQPLLIGKDAAGHKIPGGPYIVWQGLALPAAPVMWTTRQHWADTLSGLSTLIVIAAVTSGLFWAIGQLDFAGHNPAITAAAVLAAVAGSMHSRYRFPTRRLRTPRRAAIRCTSSSVQPTADRHELEPGTTHPAKPAPQATSNVTPSSPHLTHHASRTVEQRVDQTARVDQATPRLSPLESFLAAAGKV